MISGLKYRCKFDSKGNFLLVNYSDRCMHFLREEISCQNLKHILSELAYSGRNYGFREGTSEAAKGRQRCWLEPVAPTGWRLPGRQIREAGWCEEGPFSLRGTGFDGHVIHSHPRNNNSNLRHSSDQVLSDCCVRAVQSPARSGRLWSSLVCYFLNCPWTFLEISKKGTQKQ